MGVKSTVFRNNHSIVITILVQLWSGIVYDLFYECIIFFIHPVFLAKPEELFVCAKVETIEVILKKPKGESHKQNVTCNIRNKTNVRFSLRRRSNSEEVGLFPWLRGICTISA